MSLVGLGRINEGISKTEPNNPYKRQDAHFLGTGEGVVGVTGKSVEKVNVDLFNAGENFPELTIGATYFVTVSDKGYLRYLELVEKPAETRAKSSVSGFPAKPTM
jgi:hypothetical protein